MKSIPWKQSMERGQRGEEQCNPHGIGDNPASIFGIFTAYRQKA